MEWSGVQYSTVQYNWSRVEYRVEYSAVQFQRVNPYPVDKTGALSNQN